MCDAVITSAPVDCVDGVRGAASAVWAQLATGGEVVHPPRPPCIFHSLFSIHFNMGGGGEMTSPRVADHGLDGALGAAADVVQRGLAGVVADRARRHTPGVTPAPAPPPSSRPRTPSRQWRDIAPETVVSIGRRG